MKRLAVPCWAPVFFPPTVHTADVLAVRCYDKISEKINFKRRKDLFWLTISEVSVQGYLVQLLLGL
jgi:hypothetical protein